MKYEKVTFSILVRKKFKGDNRYENSLFSKIS